MARHDALVIALLSVLLVSIIKPTQHACLWAICFACVNYFLFNFKNKSFETNYLGFTKPIFIKFSSYVRYLSQIKDLSFFSDRSKDIAMAINFRDKIGEIGLLTFICRLGIPIK